MFCFNVAVLCNNCRRPLEFSVAQNISNGFVKLYAEPCPSCGTKLQHESFADVLEDSYLSEGMKE